VVMLSAYTTARSSYPGRQPQSSASNDTDRSTLIEPARFPLVAAVPICVESCRGHQMTTSKISPHLGKRGEEEILLCPTLSAVGDRLRVFVPRTFPAGSPQAGRRASSTGRLGRRKGGTSDGGSSVVSNGGSGQRRACQVRRTWPLTAGCSAHPQLERSAEGFT
jgi:hypothetical protein